MQVMSSVSKFPMLLLVGVFKICILMPPSLVKSLLITMMWPLLRWIIPWFRI